MTVYSAMKVVAKMHLVYALIEKYVQNFHVKFKI